MIEDSQDFGGWENISKDQEDKSMYSIKELSDMAGVSARTLRWYDRIGLLQPAFVNDAGYRFYGEREVDLLQQILFYRERGVELKKSEALFMKRALILWRLWRNISMSSKSRKPALTD